MCARSYSSRRGNFFFQMGLLFLLLGILGVGYFFWQSQIVGLSSFFSKDTRALYEFSFDKLGSNNQDLWEDENFSDFVNAYASETLLVDFEKEIKPWMGNRIGVAQFPDKGIIYAFEIGDKAGIDAFLDTYLTEGESFKEEIMNFGRVLSPEFSSNIGIGFHGKWLFWSNDIALLRSQFTVVEKLSGTRWYQKVAKDIPRNGFFKAFVNIPQIVDDLGDSPEVKSQKPLYEAFSKSILGLAIGGRSKPDGISFNAKFLTHEGVFHKDFLELSSPEIVPRLARNVPNDIQFFMNGIDMYAKYNHTKSFLSSLHPQFSVIFEGLLRAQSRRFFGEGFDFEKQLLSKMHGQYAWFYDRTDDENRDFGFISRFGGNDKEQTLSDFQEGIRRVQARFAPVLEEVELPDGTIRQEFVSLTAEEIGVDEISVGKYKFFSVMNPVSGGKIVYGFLDDNFLLATSQALVSEIVKATDSDQGALSDNVDFRKSIISHYPPSESYGFMGTKELISFFNLIRSEATSETLPVFMEFLNKQFRNVTFARRVYPTEVFFFITLFQR